MTQHDDPFTGFDILARKVAANGGRHVCNMEVAGCDARSTDSLRGAPVREVVGGRLSGRNMLEHRVVFAPVVKMTNGGIATITEGSRVRDNAFAVSTAADSAHRIHDAEYRRRQTDAEGQGQHGNDRELDCGEVPAWRSEHLKKCSETKCRDYRDNFLDRFHGPEFEEAWRLLLRRHAALMFRRLQRKVFFDLVSQPPFMRRRVIDPASRTRNRLSALFK